MTLVSRVRPPIHTDPSLSAEATDQMVGSHRSRSPGLRRAADLITLADVYDAVDD
jgi:hypothetical protein